MSPKQGIRLWFEFYKLALLDSNLRSNIKRSSAFYKQWGDCRSISFDKWWKLKHHLFEDTEVRVVSKVSENTKGLLLSIPLQQPLNRSIKQVRLILSEKLIERAKQAGVTNKKTKSASLGMFRLTPGVEFRHPTVHHALLIYKEIYQANDMPKINVEFLSKVQRFYRSRPRARNVPVQLITDLDSPYVESTLKTLRRYIRRAEQLKIAAANGNFPGKSYMGSKAIQ